MYYSLLETVALPSRLMSKQLTRKLLRHFQINRLASHTHLYLASLLRQYNSFQVQIHNVSHYPGINKHTNRLPSLSQNTGCSHCINILDFERLQREWRRSSISFFLGLVMGLLLVGTITGNAVVWCRSYETPIYLIPYYLRDVHTRFHHYASVRKRKDGPLYMTADDFVMALLGASGKEESKKLSASGLHDLFTSIDSDCDGCIGFHEFRFIFSLLTSRPQDMRQLFRIVDKEGQGSLSSDQFANVLRGLTKDEAVVRSVLSPTSRRGGLVRKLFGENAKPRRCSFQEINNIAHAIRVEVWKAEFQQFDVNHRGFITAEEFATLLVRHVLGSHLPLYLVESIRKQKGGTTNVSLDAWLGIHEVLQADENLGETLELHCASGLPVTRAAFSRILRVADTPLSEDVLNLVFYIFDKNNDGAIEMDEFLYIMKQKIGYHYRTTPRHVKGLAERFVQCIKEAADR
ncbi:unnamed protein product [Phytomonas sp. Hart1]|nr:unnamed protein product [Phytomonas sp. Hart1]|eukprot:CCW72109.1 unnamed protein product [Phytomonas sp. isolate Hart1]